MSRTEPPPRPAIRPVKLSAMRPHSRNYAGHPDDQIAHIVASIRANGVYRNVVIARDGTILAGHGVYRAALSLGLETLPAARLDLDPESPEALRILVGDNEIRHLIDVDDRALSELLKEIKLAVEEANRGRRRAG